MRPVLGTTPRVIARRGLASEPLAILTLGRDRFADDPGTSLTLYYAGRHLYRPACVVLDEFLREELGEGYLTVSGFDLLAIEEEAAVPAGVSQNGLQLYDSEHARDQWSETTLVEFDGAASFAVVGVGVRWDETGSGYLAEAESSSGGFTRILRYDTGTPTLLDEVETDWLAGDVLRLEAEWNVLRVYRRGVLILTVTDDSPLLTTGRPALAIRSSASADSARATAFAAGPLRQEYVGHISDIGDVTASLGDLEPTASPHSWGITLINSAPIAGASRFAALLRHGLNAGEDTYDLTGSPVRIVQAVRG